MKLKSQMLSMSTDQQVKQAKS